MTWSQQVLRSWKRLKDHTVNNKIMTIIQGGILEGDFSTHGSHEK
jgi:hypothetical protein